MRLFIAIEIPEKVKEAIDVALADLKNSVSKVRWVPKENLHLTLKFLREVNPHQVDAIKSSVAQALQQSDLSSFEMEFTGLGAFPNLNRPSVIWIGLSKGGDALLKLAEILESKLENLGFEREKGAFSPHLTIGRVKDDQKVEGFGERASRFDKTSFASHSIHVISFMQSFLSRAGASYKCLHRWTLK
ncbi:MAG: RNA 2',3'-cyclic phosphodiesterase [Chlamydiae bacterium]|nr:RNA 2',3'-cyclic phosphodiesterase [Chlamydiota bacterium]MBI3266907.1 RNA 2',3'-cyclic phosphodiesterase [Chlamydiota bacterium]